MIDKKSPIPVYYQLRNYIIQDIEKRGLMPGDGILSEREYCELFQISRMTVRQALSKLEREGIIVREKGKGSFIAIPTIEQKGLMSFTEMVKSKNMTPNTEVVEFKIVSGEEFSKILLIEPWEQVYKIKRIREADDFPVALETIFIPVKLVPNIEEKEIEGSLYEILKNDYNLSIKNSNTSFSAVTSDSELEDLLLLEKGTPLLKLESINYSNDPIYYEISYYKSDKFKLNVNIRHI